MRTALVRGPEPRIAEIAVVLGTEGFDVIASPFAEPRPPLAPRSLHCYVGMTAERSSDSVAAVRAVLAAIDDLTAVTPFLSPAATALLVTNAPAGDRSLHAATRLLGSTAVADHGHVRVTVRGEPCSPTDIATAVTAWPSEFRGSPLAGTTRLSSASAISLAELAPDLDYATWRHEILNLAVDREGTYFGWINHVGEPVVGVLRGVVLTPLRPLSLEGAMSWGQQGEGERVLAAAILSDLLGAEARCTQCHGAGAGCTGCRGSGLSEPMLDLADWLAKEVLSSLPAPGFELPASSLTAWIEQVTTVAHFPQA